MNRYQDPALNVQGRTWGAVIMLLSLSHAFAANFNITPVGVLPTTVAAGQRVSAYFIVTNMTHTVRNGYVLTGLPATVTQNTTSPHCTHPINLAPQASCQLQLDITGAVSSNVALCKGNSCTTATTPLNVSLSSAPPIARFVYVTQSASTGVLICPINSNTGAFTFSDCENADPGGALPNIYPQGIRINQAGTTTFISGINTTDAYQCTIDHTTGIFTDCSGTSITQYNPNGGFLALNSANNHTYLPDYNGGTFVIRSCSVVNNTIQNDCTSTATPPVPSTVSGAGIAVNRDNSMGYVSLYPANAFLACSIGDNIWSSSCNTVDTLNTATGPVSIATADGGVAFNPDYSILYLAIADVNFNGKVYGCDPASLSGTGFNTCFLATEFTNNKAPWVHNH